MNTDKQEYVHKIINMVYLVFKGMVLGYWNSTVKIIHIYWMCVGD